jgi:4-diphosphocytidyl-2-C-methyl-D-erythritol kinase
MGTEFAPAKINLTLHVTGQRADGYHLLDSLVVFAGVGDRVTVDQAATLSLSISGEHGANLPVSDDNLVLRAARAFQTGQGAALTLEKRLPVASGIGGGSADAAATLRALSRVWGLPLPSPAQVTALGADVPVCLAGRPCRMQGIGDWLEPLSAPLPKARLVLVNPGVALSTPAVFKALAERENPPMPPAIPLFETVEALAAFLQTCRNDLEPAAISVAPKVGQVLASLQSQPGCLLARMSGSGATCFGLFADADLSGRAAEKLRHLQPGWWIAEAEMLA